MNSLSRDRNQNPRGQVKRLPTLLLAKAKEELLRTIKARHEGEEDVTVISLDAVLATQGLNNIAILDLSEVVLTKHETAEVWTTPLRAQLTTILAEALLR